MEAYCVYLIPTFLTHVCYVRWAVQTSYHAATLVVIQRQRALERPSQLDPILPNKRCRMVIPIFWNYLVEPGDQDKRNLVANLKELGQKDVAKTILTRFKEGRLNLEDRVEDEFYANMQGRWEEVGTTLIQNREQYTDQNIHRIIYRTYFQTEHARLWINRAIIPALTDYITLSVCQRCDRPVAEDSIDQCDHCGRHQCTNPNCPSPEVVNTSIHSGTGFNSENCPHGHRACNPGCFRSLCDGGNYFGTVYSCHKCYQVFCADCNPPISVYPANENVEDDDWDRIAELQSLFENPYECKACVRSGTVIGRR